MKKHLNQWIISILLALLSGAVATFYVIWLVWIWRYDKEENFLRLDYLVREIVETVKGSNSYAELLDQWPTYDMNIENRIVDRLHNLCEAYQLEDAAVFGVNSNREPIFIRMEAGEETAFRSWIEKIARKSLTQDDKASVEFHYDDDRKFYALSLNISSKTEAPVYLGLYFNNNGLHKTPSDSFRKLIIIAMLNFLFFVILILSMLFRQRKSYYKGLYIESLFIFLIGFLLALAYTYYTNHKQNLEISKVFRSLSENRLQNFRMAFKGLHSELLLTKAFIESSEEVTPQEFDFFTSSYARNKTFYEGLFVVKYSDSPYKDSPDLLCANVRTSVKKFDHCGDCENIALNNETLNLIHASRESGLFHAGVILKPNGISTLNSCLIVVFPLKNMASDNGVEATRFLVAVINSQEFLDTSLSEGNAFSRLVPISLAYAKDNSTDTLEWIAVYPHEHHQIHKDEDNKKHSEDYSHVTKLPVFFGGKTFYLVSQNSPEFLAAFASSDVTFIFSLILLSFFLLALLIFLLRKHWIELETAVERRTNHLNRKIHELELLQGLNEQLNASDELSQILKWLCVQYNDDKFLSKNATLLIFLHGQVLCKKGKQYDTPAGQTIQLDIMDQERVIGSMELVFQLEDEEDFYDEDFLFLKQLQHRINTWISFTSTRQKLSETEERLKVLIEATFDGVYMLKNNKFVFVNQAFANMLEYERDELVSPDFDINHLLTPRSIEIFNQRKELRARGLNPEPRFDFQQITKSGRVLDVELSLATVKLSGEDIVFGIVRDVTEQRFIEKALRNSEERLQQQNEELQSMNEELSASNSHMRELNLVLSEALKRAEAADKLKTAFLKNISHEVRTPLNGICGAAEILSSHDLDASEKTEIIEMLNISTRRLLRTITEYMDISLLESDNMPVVASEISFKALMEPVLGEFEDLCKRKGLEFRFENHLGDGWLYTDKSLLEKVISHLLDNAVKFTSQGSIIIKAHSQGDNIALTITDTGIGISKAFQPKIFDLFLQEDISDRRKYDGSGLGLPIVKRIILLLGGSLSFESEKEKGTTFHVLLPAKYISKHVVGTNSLNVERSEPLHILVAEDEDSNFMVLKLLIEKKLKATITRAVNGEQAVDFVRKYNDIRLVLMDVKMPHMDGLEATRLIKALKPNLPVIAITAYGLSGDEQRVLDAGCDEYIAKPLQVNELFEKIHKHASYQPIED